MLLVTLLLQKLERLDMIIFEFVVFQVPINQVKGISFIFSSSSSQKKWKKKGEGASGVDIRSKQRIFSGMDTLLQAVESSSRETDFT